MRVILKNTEQNGETFMTGTGLAQVLLEGAVAGKSYTLQVKEKDSSTWVDTDVEFSGDGLQTFYTSVDWEYRMIGEDAASIGATVYLSILGLD